jgi:hypothetical protein
MIQGITITILEIIVYISVFYLKDMSRIVIVILIYHRHKPINSINLLGS